MSGKRRILRGVRDAILPLAFFLLAMVASAAADDLAARVVVLANSRQPQSLDLARFYAVQRHVPEANIVALPLPEEEKISWRQFVDEVWTPLQDELLRRGWIEGTTSGLRDRMGRKRQTFTDQRISYLVICRGMPLRIANDPALLSPQGKIPPQFSRNEAAVDSELSLLAWGDYETTGPIGNPLVGRQGPLLPDAAQIVKVSRLDGPDWESARALVVSALTAERDGLIGRYYIDFKGPHPDGDTWLEATRAMLARLGFDGDVENTPATFATDTRFDAPALYFGWYASDLNGPFVREGFRFPPGAIALHIHSFSAATLRSPQQGWSGPLVARGVTATVGNVYEPYLQLTHRPDRLFAALAMGSNWGDAVYYALPALSWQALAIGDPLYRPFGVSVDEQQARSATLPAALRPYVAIRQANLLSAQKRTAEAIALLRKELAARPDPAIAMKLAELVAKHGDAEAAAGEKR